MCVPFSIPEMEKNPFTSVVVPLVVPMSAMFAPIIVSPVDWSMIWPDTVKVCENPWVNVAISKIVARIFIFKKDFIFGVFDCRKEQKNVMVVRICIRDVM